MQVAALTVPQEKMEDIAVAWKETASLYYLCKYHFLKKILAEYLFPLYAFIICENMTSMIKHYSSTLLENVIATC